MESNSPERRRLFESHPIAIAVTVVVVLFLIGGVIVLRRSGRAPDRLGVAWGTGATTFQNPTAITPAYGQGEISFATESDATSTVRFPSGADVPAQAASSTKTQVESFLGAFIGEPPRASASDSGGSTFDTQALSTYLYMPQGLLNISTAKARTPLQDALHGYGNAAGSMVKSFEETHPDMVAALSAYTSDRENADARNGMKRLASDIESIGTAMLSIEEVPEAARASHEALANKYVAVGTQLALIAETEEDEGYLAAINAYNATADSFTRSYLNLMTVFSISGVTFGAHEGGSVFMFLGGGGF